MDWTLLTSPVAGLLGVLVGAGISSRTQRSTHRERLTADSELSERKTNADIALAEKKFAFDKAIVGWRRRYELAEQLLTAAYEARVALDWARGRAIMSGEGETRAAPDTESEELRRARNTAFVPIERLHRNAKTFATLDVLQYAAATHFGSEAIEPVATILGVHNNVRTAASILVEMTQEDDDRHSREALRPVRNTIWGDRPDENDKKLDTAIRQLETICRPILAENAPA